MRCCYPHSLTAALSANYLLWPVCTLLVCLTLYFYTRSRRLKREQEALSLSGLTLKTDLEVARLIIDPHFMFNSLSVLQNFILSKDHVQANDYMVKFSKLVRRMLESNAASTTLLEKEMTLLKSYFEFKAVNFGAPFRYSVESDASVVPSETYIPAMMIQPFIENALWRGFVKKQGEKTIHITFSLVQQIYILCVIRQSGVSARSHDQKKKLPLEDLLQQRLELLNKLHRLSCSLTVEDLPDEQGTITTFFLPALRK